MFELTVTSIMPIFVTFECMDCYALLPFPKAGHNCPDSFGNERCCDRPRLMELFLLALEEAKKNPPVTVKYIYAD